MAPVQANERAQQVDQRAAVAKMVTAARARAGAKWFYCIAGLSMINSLAVMSGASFHFVVGLGATLFVDVMARKVGSMGSVLDIVINGFGSGAFVLFGHFAVKAQKWAFLVGMGLYALDGLLLLGVKDYLGVGFHAYVLFAIYRGLQAAEQVQG
jgi:hypothetical protein